MSQVLVQQLVLVCMCWLEPWLGNIQELLCPSLFWWLDLPLLFLHFAMQSWLVAVLLLEVHITTLTSVLEKGIHLIHILSGFLFLFISLHLLIVMYADFAY